MWSELLELDKNKKEKKIKNTVHVEIVKRIEIKLI